MPQKPTARVSLIYRTEPTTKSGKQKVLRSKNTDMLRSVAKQFGKSAADVVVKTFMRTRMYDAVVRKTSTSLLASLLRRVLSPLPLSLPLGTPLMGT